MSDIVDVRVNGAKLPEYIGRNVRVIAKVLRFVGQSAKVELTDGVQAEVKITGDHAITETLVELVAKVESPNMLVLMAWYPIKTANELQMFVTADKIVNLMHREGLRDLFY